MKTCLLYETLPNDSVRCTACAHHCVIGLEQTGLCGVRQNAGGKLQLLVYGHASAVAVDPIEKKPLFHVLPGSEILSIGTLGCNFGCAFCQNWDISQTTKDLRRQYQGGTYAAKLEKLERFGKTISPEQLVDYAVTRKIPALAFTYNEPTVFFEYAYDTMMLAKHHNLKTVFVSNGYQSDAAVEKLRGVLDAINIDLKSMSPEFYRKTCKAKLQPVLDNIRRFDALGIWVEITTLLIPGQNNSDAEVQTAAEFIASVDPKIPWHLTAFHPDYLMHDTQATPLQTLQRSYQIAKDVGLAYVYVGNVSDPKLENSYCENCDALLIQRHGYDVNVERLSNGTCAACGQKIPGLWQ